MSTVTVLRPRVIPAPKCEPPFDTGPGPRRESPGTTQGTLALTFTLPSGVPATPAALHAVPLAEPDTEREPVIPGLPGADRVLPDVDGWAAMLAQAVAEVLAAQRPVPQLQHWTTPEIYASLARRAALAERAARTTGCRPRTRLGSLWVCRPAPGVAEVSTVIHAAQRTRAMAFRLEAHRNKWVCTVLELG